MKGRLRSLLCPNANEANRSAWLAATLRKLPPGCCILDAGAGELRNRPLCAHLEYTSQDFGQHKGIGNGKGLQPCTWDTSRVDVISDITAIPKPDESFHAILCSEVLEHLPEPTKALDEFARLLRRGGKLILTAPFASVVHFAPYHYCSGFSRYWYEYHLPRRGFVIEELSPNGDWFALWHQELARLGSMARRHGSWSWPLGYVLGFCGAAYFRLCRHASADDLACFGWHCVATKP